MGNFFSRISLCRRYRSMLHSLRGSQSKKDASAAERESSKKISEKANGISQNKMSTTTKSNSGLNSFLKDENTIQQPSTVEEKQFEQGHSSQVVPKSQVQAVQGVADQTLVARDQNLVKEGSEDDKTNPEVEEASFEHVQLPKEDEQSNEALPNNSATQDPTGQESSSAKDSELEMDEIPATDALSGNIDASPEVPDELPPPTDDLYPPPDEEVLLYIDEEFQKGLDFSLRKHKEVMNALIDTRQPFTDAQLTNYHNEITLLILQAYRQANQSTLELDHKEVKDLFEAKNTKLTASIRKQLVVYKRKQEITIEKVTTMVKDCTFESIAFYEELLGGLEINFNNTNGDSKEDLYNDNEQKIIQFRKDTIARFDELILKKGLKVQEFWRYEIESRIEEKAKEFVKSMEEATDSASNAGPTDIVATGIVDTGIVDTGIVDTGIVDTGILDTGIVDTGMVATGNNENDSNTPPLPSKLSNSVKDQNDVSTHNQTQDDSVCIAMSNEADETMSSDPVTSAPNDNEPSTTSDSGEVTDLLTSSSVDSGSPNENEAFTGDSTNLGLGKNCQIPESTITNAEQEQQHTFNKRKNIEEDCNVRTGETSDGSAPSKREKTENEENSTSVTDEESNEHQSIADQV